MKKKHCLYFICLVAFFIVKAQHRDPSKKSQPKVGLVLSGVVLLIRAGILNQQIKDQRK